MKEKLSFSDCVNHRGFHNLPNIQQFFDLYEDIFQSEIIDKSFLQECFVRFNVPESKRKVMARAKVLLKDTNLKSFEIATQVGYENTSYFSKTFKRLKMTPNEYRTTLASIS